MSQRPCSRRSFLKTSAALAAAPLLPRLSSRSPLNTLNVACIGVGGMGASDLASVAAAEGVRIAALCDVDKNHLDAAARRHPQARTFADFRQLFEQMRKEIDAVTVSTPDHMHAPIAAAALQLGLHVYCQKPLAHDLRECRRLQELAGGRKLATQMGVQIHGHPAYRTAVATLRQGALGRIREAHAWVGKSWAGPAGGRPAQQDPVPDTLAWDLWLGVAPERPFVKDLYHPANWRGWLDFGTGTLGDMGCHILDPLFAALGLGPPLEVLSKGPQHQKETFAGDGNVTWTFAETPQTVGRLPLRWSDGGAAPEAARAHLPDGVRLPGSGSFVVGERGVMVLPHWAMPTFYREGKPLEVALQQREAVDHYAEWTAACRGEGQTSTPFAYSAPLSETVLVGTVAGHCKDRLLRWNSAGLTFGDAAADAHVARSYRQGWQLP